MLVNNMLNKVYDEVSITILKTIKEIIAQAKLQTKILPTTNWAEYLIKELGIPPRQERNIFESVELPPVKYILASPEMACLLTKNSGNASLCEYIKDHDFIESCHVYSYLLLGTNQIYLLEDNGEDIKILKAFYVAFDL